MEDYHLIEKRRADVFSMSQYHDSGICMSVKIKIKIKIFVMQMLFFQMLFFGRAVQG